MPNYRRIIELRPEMADFFRNPRLVSFRGDVISYGPNIRTDSFTTDAGGFRHTSFAGKDWSAAECLQESRYGLVLGASNFFGFGVAGNENCTASLLSERFGFPFANGAMPGGNSRNLQSLLVGLIAAASRPPAIVVYSNGGDLANFCQASMADPIFGSPNRSQLQTSPQPADPDADGNFPRCLAFTSLWTSAVATLCRAYGAGLVMVHQSTFFEKTKPTEFERECSIGTAFSPAQKRPFENHRKFNEPFYANRRAIAESLKLPLAGVDTNDLTFLDEFHCDREGIRLMTDAVAEKIEPLLAGAEEPAAAAS